VIKVSPEDPIHGYSLLCVDGVKVLTTTKSTAITSIIIPGPCDGKYVQQQKQQKQQQQVQQIVNPQSGRTMVNW